MAHRRSGHNNKAQTFQTVDADDELTPAQRYAAFRNRREYDSTAAADFARSLPFPLDDFQIEATKTLEAGENVLVAAPTGAGKTVVADFAMYLAERRQVKAFYTTPIKALSNQKYHDLVALYGADHVGLLTGDTSINSEANIVVMTTEVLRNMLYEKSETLRNLRYVILDEVHYLADKFRGPVWEEVIIHLPASVRIVGLSATVSNIEDFGRWIESVRGKTRLVVSEHRPVPLEQHVIVQSDDRHEPELIDLYRHTSEGEQTDRLNAGLVQRLDQLDHQARRRASASRYEGRGRHGGRRENHQSRERNVQRHIPKRWAVVDELDFLGMLPGIYFIFSRNGCDQAVEQCLNAGLKLTSESESRRIRSIVDEMVAGQLDHDDLKALGFSKFRFALEMGFAAHHAGMVALFRQIVERLFEEGLIKMVFATETLALGINMPARCVVIEKLEKFNGTDHVTLTPGEYTQLTGRAGRRGIDTIGHAIVVDHRDFNPATLATLTSKRVYPLHSSFKPTFNMAVNLLNSSDYATARATLDHSFAQWEANNSAGELQSRIVTLEHAVTGYEDAFACSHGDFKEFMTIRRDLSDLQKNGRRRIKRRRYASDKDRERAVHDLDERISALKRREQQHSCRECPDLKTHVKWGNRWVRDSRELEHMRKRYDSRTGSVARQFDRICHILWSLGYLEGSDGSGDKSEMPSYRLTARGQLLRHLYSEYDLVLAEAIAEGVFDRLTPDQLASVLSSLVYQARRGDGGEPRRYPGGPQGRIAQASSTLREIFENIQDMRDDADLDEMEALDFGLVDVIADWADGENLTHVLHDTELTGGDFVRNAKRLSDLLQQISVARGYLDPEIPDTAGLAGTARETNKRVDRDIVAYSGVD